jgi:large subunit ribosomal protein L4
MEITVKNIKNEEVGKAELSKDIFEAEIKEHLLHSTVKMQLTNRRRGTASVKTRDIVRGSGKKPWAQKGTGRARSGSVRSPLWRGGGIVFGPIPKIYNSKLNKKVKKAALKSALSLKVKNGEFFVVEEIEPKSHKTKDMLSLLSGFTSEKVKTLIVIHELKKNIILGSRNIPDLKVIATEGLNVYDLLLYKKVICTKAALEKIQGRMQ